MAVSLSSLRNPAPSNGLSLGGNHYKSTPNFTGQPSLAMFSRPSAHVRDGQQGNASVSIGIRIRPHLEDYSTYSEGHMLFTFRDLANKHRREFDLLTIANIPQINYMFEKNGFGSKITTPLDAAFRSDGDGGDTVHLGQQESPQTSSKALQNFIKNYSFLGVTKINVGKAKDKFNQAFAIDTYGRSNIRNIWGRVIAGDRLYVEISSEVQTGKVVKDYVVPGRRRLRPDGIFIGSVGKAPSGSVYQARGVKNPNLEHGCFKKDRVLIPIGIVGETPTMVYTPNTGKPYGQRTHNEPVRTDAEYSRLPFVTVFIGVSVPLEPIYLFGDNDCPEVPEQKQSGSSAAAGAQSGETAIASASAPARAQASASASTPARAQASAPASTSARAPENVAEPTQAAAPPSTGGRRRRIKRTSS